MKTKKYLLIHQHFERRSIQSLISANSLHPIFFQGRDFLSLFYLFICFSAPCFALTYRLLYTNSFHHFFLKLPLDALKAVYYKVLGMSHSFPLS